jgi:hypothetical protein
MSRNAATMSCALLGAALIAASCFPAAAQTSRPASPMQQGAGQMMYGGCMADVLSGPQRSAVGALAALNPSAAAAMAVPVDDTDQMAMWCSKAIHDQRCTTKIVAVLGDQLGKGNPAAKVKPPSDLSLVVAGAAVGGVLGMLSGNQDNKPVSGAVKGALYGGGIAWAGTKALDKARNAAAAARCEKTRADLDAISAKLGGSLGPVGSINDEDVRLLIVGNVQAHRITQAEADMLQLEVTRLSGKVDELFVAMR